MKYTIQMIVCGAYQENAWLLCPEAGEGALLIDPGDDLPALKRAVFDSGRKLAGILLTHGHFDHMLSAKALADSTGAKLYVHAEDAVMLTNPELNGYNPDCSTQRCPEEIETTPLGTELECAGIHFEVLHTPGHSRGSVCYYDAENGQLFSGDTLFCMGFGRMDLFGGSPAQMRTSLRKLFELPPETQVHCGHGMDTTIGNERGRYRL